MHTWYAIFLPLLQYVRVCLFVCLSSDNAQGMSTSIRSTVIRILFHFDYFCTYGISLFRACVARRSPTLPQPKRMGVRLGQLPPNHARLGGVPAAHFSGSSYLEEELRTSAAQNRTLRSTHCMRKLTKHAVGVGTSPK